MSTQTDIYDRQNEINTIIEKLKTESIEDEKIKIISEILDHSKISGILLSNLTRLYKLLVTDDIILHYSGKLTSGKLLYNLDYLFSRCPQCKHCEDLVPVHEMEQDVDVGHRIYTESDYQEILNLPKIVPEMQFKIKTMSTTTQYKINKVGQVPYFSIIRNIDPLFMSYLIKSARILKRGQDVECPICLSFIYFYERCKTKCNHIFHEKCILTALSKSKNKSCPLCRAIVDKDDFLTFKKCFKHEGLGWIRNQTDNMALMISLYESMDHILVDSEHVNQSEK